MRVSTKLNLAFILGGFLIFGAYGWYHLGAEEDDLRRAVAQETQLLGRMLQVAITNALRDGQVNDVEVLCTQLERIEPSLHLFVADPKGHLLAGDPGVIAVARIATRFSPTALTSRHVAFQFHPADAPALVEIGLPLTLPPNGRPLGRLVVVRSLGEMQRDLAATQRDILISALVYVLTTAGLGMIVGVLYIGRPLSQMAKAMRHVRAGDLVSLLPVRHQDEVGVVAAEFNAMVTELRAARQRLEEEADSRRRLQRALQQADKLITIGQLSAGLAHEIGSPLQVLSGRARALLTHAYSAEETRRHAEILVTQTDRITRIVEQLLQFARRRPAVRGPTDMVVATQMVLDLLRYEAQRRGVSLICSSEPDLPPVLADADGIQQIVLNLVVNGLAVTPYGGTVQVDIERSMLRGPLLGQERPAVRLTVTDTGCGMSAEVRERLFEPFFTTRAADGGTGLGLAVVKSIVTDHGGMVAVESASGAGSRFTVDLPIDSPVVPRER